MSAAAELLDFKIDSAEVKRNPYPLLQRLREEDPVHYLEQLDCWLVTRYEDIFELYTDPRLTGDRRRGEHYMQPAEGSFFRWVDDHGLMALDKKNHSKQRRLIGSGLTPRGVRDLDGRIREVVDHFAKPLHGRTGVVDIMKEYTTPIPIVVVGFITGVSAPGVDDTQFSELAQAVIRGFFGMVSPEVLAQSEHNYLQLSDWVKKTIQQRREKLEDDLISHLIKASREGEFFLDDDGIVAQVSSMLAAGTETTSSGGVTCLMTLLDHPETLERVRADRSLLPQTVDEVLRYGFGGVGGTQRFALEDFEYQGRKVHKGQMMMLSSAGASYDPEVYDDPETFDIDRDQPGLLTFGLGPHYCLGANLARAELRNIIDAALDFLPPGARVLHDQIETQDLGMFDRKTNCPVDFGNGS